MTNTLQILFHFLYLLHVKLSPETSALILSKSPAHWYTTFRKRRLYRAKDRACLKPKRKFGLFRSLVLCSFECTGKATVLYGQGGRKLLTHSQHREHLLCARHLTLGAAETTNETDSSCPRGAYSLIISTMYTPTMERSSRFFWLGGIPSPPNVLAFVKVLFKH